MGIKKVGIELEGGWKGEQYPFPDAPFEHDVSVMPPKGFVEKSGIHHWGECKSAPLDTEEALKWMAAHYPTHIPTTLNPGTSQEKSVGLHTHISFEEPWEYRALVSIHFRDRVLEEFEKWGKKVGLPKEHIFWHRHAGGNRFCTKDFRPGPQMAMTGKGHNNLTRRTQINFAHFMNTIEFRMLPMFPDPRLRHGKDSEKVTPPDIELAVDAIRFYYEVVEGWLAERRAEETAHRVVYRAIGVAKPREGVVTRDYHIQLERFTYAEKEGV